MCQLDSLNLGRYSKTFYSFHLTLAQSSQRCYACLRANRRPLQVCYHDYLDV
jgi:hypothetical protein